MQIVRKFLSADEVSSPNQRYNADCDCIQVSPDGGTTWNDDPGADPRRNPAALLPPRGGGTAQCDAAEAMTQHFKALVDAFIDAGTILGTANIWLALLFFIPGVNVLIALLLSIADALFTTGVVVVAAAMTEEVYEQIKCILLCRIGMNGQMSADQLIGVYDDVDAQIGGVAGTVFHAVTSAWGEVGFSNAGASGEVTGDCDDCECAWSHEFDFAINDGGFVACDWFGQGDKGEYIGACCWQSQLDAAEGHQVLCVSLTIDMPAGSQLTYFYGTGEWTSFTQLLWDGVEYFTFPTIITNTVSAGEVELQVKTNSLAPSLVRWYTITLAGTGDDPFL